MKILSTKTISCLSKAKFLYKHKQNKYQKVFVIRKCCLWLSTADCSNTGIEKYSVSAEHSEKLSHYYKEGQIWDKNFKLLLNNIHLMIFPHFFIECRKMVENI